jgi:hypothetical protein
VNVGRTLFSQVMDSVPWTSFDGSWHGMPGMFVFAVFVAVNSFASWHLRK